MRGPILASMLLASLAPAPLFSGQSVPRVDQMLAPMCQVMLQQLVSRDPGMMAALADQRLDERAVCSCANERFVSDREISRLADKPVDQLARDLPGQKERVVFTSYLALRAVQHIMGCFSEELERQLRDVELNLAGPSA
jgi:hypothetical protein